MRSTTYDPASTIFDGIAAFDGENVGGASWSDGRTSYRRLAPEIRSVMRPGDTCELGFAAKIERLDGTAARCFVAVLHDRVVVAWRRGTIRPRSGTTVIRRSSVTSIEVVPGERGVARPKVCIAAEPDVALLAPAGSELELHQLLRTTLIGDRP